MATKTQPVKIQWLTNAAANRVLEKRAKRVLGLSAAEFRKRLKGGKYSGTPVDQTPGVLELATLCLFAEKPSARKISRRSR
jgi:hypothetical protein